MPRKPTPKLCCVCGWLTGNVCNWVLRKTRLFVCDFCKEDFILFGFAKAAFKRAQYYHVEKHHAPPMWHLVTVTGEAKEESQNGQA